MTSISQGRVELRQSITNVLQGPILVAVVLLAIVIRQQFAHPPSRTILGVCVGLAVLDIVFAVYCLRNIGSALVVTPADITFTKRRREGEGSPPQQVIQRAAGSVLSFRMAANGIRGSEYTGYALKLRDNVTGGEVYAGAFGRRKVQQACESQGWSFSLRPKPPCPWYRLRATSTAPPPAALTEASVPACPARRRPARSEPACPLSGRQDDKCAIASAWGRQAKSAGSGLPRVSLVLAP